MGQMKQVAVSRVVDCEQEAEHPRGVAARASDEVGEGGEGGGPVAEELRRRESGEEEVGGGGEARDRRQEQN